MNAALNPGDRLGLTDVVALIAERIQDRGERPRAAKDKVRKRIKYDVEHGNLECESDGMFVASNLGQWARILWPGKFDDIPVIAMSAGAITSGSDTCSGIGIATPMTLKACHAVITEQVRRILALETQIRGLEKALSDLRPDAEKWRERCRKNRANAAKRRKGL